MNLLYENTKNANILQQKHVVSRPSVRYTDSVPQTKAVQTNREYWRAYLLIKVMVTVHKIISEITSCNHWLTVVLYCTGVPFRSIDTRNPSITCMGIVSDSTVIHYYFSSFSIITHRKSPTVMGKLEKPVFFLNDARSSRENNGLHWWYPKKKEKHMKSTQHICCCTVL